VADPVANLAAPVVGQLDLVEIDTPDGVFRFLLGVDGVFVDINGNQWIGSQILGVGEMDLSINGSAPELQLTLSFFQDPDAPDLMREVSAPGVDYIEGREVRLFVQDLFSTNDLYAPIVAPELFATRIARRIGFSMGGPRDRTITLHCESVSEDRRSARRLQLDRRGHEALIGAENPSLEFMPTTDWEEEKIWV
jgi:hypothetical protein